MLLAAFMLATIGGRYTWPVLPGLIAAAALFLASDEAANLTGVALPVDGGYIAR